jgi:hypothetical protein
MIAAPRLEMLLVAVIDERVEVGDRLDHDVSAAPAIAPIGAAELDEFLAMKADAPGTAVATKILASSRNFIAQSSVAPSTQRGVRN